MNYQITFIYLNKDLFLYEILPLLIETFESADYFIKICGNNLTIPDITPQTTIKIIGSKKNEIKKVIIDLDNVVRNSKHLVVKPDIILNNNNHYWQLAGCLIKSFPDTSTAFFTGYLTDNNKKDLLEIFMSSKPIANF